MFKARLLFEKTDTAKYISNLDLMRTFQRAFARTQLPVGYTEGFNPHMYVSVLLPIPTCFEGRYELLDFEFDAENIPENALEKLNVALPLGLLAKEIYAPVDHVRDIAAAGYEIIVEMDRGFPKNTDKAIEGLFNEGPVMVLKRTKRSETEVDIRNYIKSLKVHTDGRKIVIKTVLSAGSAESLNPEYLVKAIQNNLPDIEIDGVFYIRNGIFKQDLSVFR